MSEDGGSSFVFWVIGGVIVLTIVGIAATIWISVTNDVSSGYVPIEERGDPAEERALDAGP